MVIVDVGAAYGAVITSVGDVVQIENFAVVAVVKKSKGYFGCWVVDVVTAVVVVPCQSMSGVAPVVAVTDNRIPVLIAATTAGP